MTICPICNKKNQCAVEQSIQCWCFNANIDKALLALVPNSLKNKSCICLECVSLFKKNPEEIKRLLKISS